MSDISFHFEWWEWLLASPILGWPGLIGGAIIGAALWRKKPVGGAIIGAIIGNLLIFALRLAMK